MRAGQVIFGLMLLAGCQATSTGIGGVTPPVSTTPGACNTTNHVCTGEVNVVLYNAANDTLSINNLPFDLSGLYQRVSALDRNGFRAYQNASGSKTYVALYSNSVTGNTHAGVVGTGDYLTYGYGGTVFGNSGNVVMPASGEAIYDGKYAAVRVYDTGGYGFADGDVNMSVDFNDFDTVGAVDTVVTNRHAYDSSGALLGNLPTLSGTTTQFNGNLIKSTTVKEILAGGATGSSGTLTGIFGGPNGNEVAGVIVLTGKDPLSTANTKETGAFILYLTQYTP